MIYDILHRSSFAYDEEVPYARCVLRLTPRSFADQTRLASRIVVTPTPARETLVPGAFGEEVRAVAVTQPHRKLIIESYARVDVHTPPIAFAFDTPWESVRAASLKSAELGADGPASFIYPTERAPIAEEITAYARESFAPGRPVIEAAGELMARIHADFRYDPGATDVSTPAPDAFAARHGVCQDFAHIMIAGLRGLGLPAAYVSGYLNTGGGYQGADATHAWVSLWCGGAAGWVGFDPTNAVITRNDHIVLAIGRDYADVAPIDGVLLAQGRAQRLTVEVRVTAEG
jgi:transglutaminase-like putative cysteine protease